LLQDRAIMSSPFLKTKWKMPELTSLYVDL
jgi:hypothetical protein